MSNHTKLIPIYLALAVLGFINSPLTGLITVIISLITLKLSQKDLSGKDKLFPVWVTMFSFLMTYLMGFEVCSLGIVLTNLSLTLLNALMCLSVILFFILITKTPLQGIATGSCLLILFSTVDRYVYNFRGTELSPEDFSAAKTALNVAAGYNFTPDSLVVITFALLLQLLVITAAFHFPPIDKKKALAVTLGVIMLTAGSYKMITKDLVSIGWGTHGTAYNGALLNFSMKIREGRMKEPEGYDADNLKKILASYEDTDAEDCPNIIVIVNESFADLNQNTNKEVMPFINSLSENTVKGYAYVSVFGGETPKSEYEFLTGTSLGLLPRGLNPFLRTVDENTYSIVSELKSRGYYCVGMHPYKETGWNRENVYPDLGFDKSLFIDDFPQKDILGEYVSDREMYKTVISEFENSEKPVFIYGMTMQNHGAYDAEGRPDDIKLTDKDFPEADQYLSLVHESDAAAGELVKYFAAQKEKTIILFFGDHLPKLPEEFYEGFTQEELYRVPFFVWTNYESDSKDNEITSLNYLQNYIYEKAGFMPKYNAFLEDVRKEYPVICSQGYLDEGFKSIPDDGIMNIYRQIAYNSNFDESKVLRKN